MQQQLDMLAHAVAELKQVWTFVMDQLSNTLAAAKGQLEGTARRCTSDLQSRLPSLSPVCVLVAPTANYMYDSKHSCLCRAPDCNSPGSPGRAVHAAKLSHPLLPCRSAKRCGPHSRCWSLLPPLALPVSKPLTGSLNWAATMNPSSNAWYRTATAVPGLRQVGWSGCHACLKPRVTWLASAAGWCRRRTGVECRPGQCCSSCMKQVG